MTIAVQAGRVGALRSDFTLRVFLKTVTYFISVCKTHLILLSIHSRSVLLCKNSISGYILKTFSLGEMRNLEEMNSNLFLISI